MNLKTEQQLSVEVSTVPSTQVEHPVTSISIRTLQLKKPTNSTMRLCIINLCPRARLSTRSSTAASGCSVADQVRSAALLPALLFSAVSEFHLGEEEKNHKERKLASRAGAEQRFCWFGSWFFSFSSIAHTTVLIICSKCSHSEASRL